MFRFHHVALILFLLCAAISAEGQKTIRVPLDQASIQSAIDAASNGDTVAISPGIYTGAIDFEGKSITVEGAGGGVILDGKSEPGPVVSFTHGEMRDSILENVTVQNGSPLKAEDAGGILVKNASPSILNSTIQNNKGCGIASYAGAPLIQGNTISGNNMPFYIGCNTGSMTYPVIAGGGIAILGMSSGGQTAQIIGNTIKNNMVWQFGAGISADNAGQLLIENNIITQNLSYASGAISTGGNTAPTIVQNLIYANTINPILAVPAHGNTGAGLNLSIGLGSVYGLDILVVNNTIAGNQLLAVDGTNQTGTQFYAELLIDHVKLYNNLIIGTDARPPVDCLVTPPVGTVINPPMFYYNDVFTPVPGAAVYSENCLDQTGQNGNISADPNFAPATADALYPYQPRLPSPVIDTGNNNAPALIPLDFLGRPRLQSGTGSTPITIDMGVYEYPGIPGILPPPPPPPPPVTPTFSVSLSPTILTLQTEHHGNVTVSVVPTTTGLGTVSLGCTNLPPHASCTFQSQILNLASGDAQSTKLTVDTSDVLGYARVEKPSLRSLAPEVFAGLIFPSGLLLLTRKRSGTHYRLISILLLTLGLFDLLSCSGKYPASTPLGTYTLNVTATDTGQSAQQATLTLVVSP